MCRWSWNLGASTSWDPQGLSGPVMELLYLLVLHNRVSFVCHRFCVILAISISWLITMYGGWGNSQGMSFFVKGWLRWGYSASCKTQFFNFFCFLHTTPTIFLKKSLFLFAPLQLSSRKKLYLCGKKHWNGIFPPCIPPPSPPSYAYDLRHSIAKIFSCLFSGGKCSIGRDNTFSSFLFSKFWLASIVTASTDKLLSVSCPNAVTQMHHITVVV